jgi:hypothetical protein
MIKDFDFFGPQVYRDVLIDSETRGLANVVAWLRPNSEDADAVIPAAMIRPDLANAKPVERSIRASRDGFTPRVTAARAGDTLLFANLTRVPFTVNYQRASASEFNVLLPPGRTHSTRPLPATRLCDTVSDNIHNWIEARVWAFDHPYFAVTDPNGRFEIAGAPVGTWRLVTWHERTGYGPGGRLGRPIEIGEATELTPVELSSANWGEPPP